MAARSPQHDEAGWFTTPAQVNHRRYEALRAWFVDGLSYQQAADRFGYTRWAMVNLVREWRAGLAGRGKQLQPSAAPLADQVDHRPAGVAEPVGGLLVGQPVDEEGAQRLVAAVVDLRRRGEPSLLALW